MDATVFALAFQAGQAEQYKGRTIAGTGLAFGVSGPALLLTVGASSGDGQVQPVTTSDQFTAAQNAHTTLQVMVAANGPMTFHCVPLLDSGTLQKQ